MPATDCISLLLIHAALAFLLILSFLAWIRAKSRVRRGAAKLTVKRGEKSMNALYVWYGVMTVAYSLAVSVSGCAEGHKTTLIAIDYIILTYLFFLDSWFRNRIVFRVMKRVEED